LRPGGEGILSRRGEQLYPRNWNFHFIGLPVVDEKKQLKPSLAASEVDQILGRAKGRYKVLFALLTGTGLRIGEALGLKLGERLSGDFSTIRVRQSVWRGSVQAPKTDNAVRGIDIPASLAALLKASVSALHSKKLSPKTVIEIVGLIKIVVASIVEDEGAPIYPRAWNHEFMDMAVLGKHSPSESAGLRNRR
jgi:integrase